jgi:MinD superfamily P-loop ATPase
VLSGKGGTGKTTVATNLSRLMGCHYIDCDVEEPNGFIFLKPESVESEGVDVDSPVIDQDKCMLCGKCSDVCQFHALMVTRKSVIVYEHLCHACGACKIVCKSQAISYRKRAIGRIDKGRVEDSQVWCGILNVGEYMAVPVIRQMLSALLQSDAILDCPPGTSCNVVNTIAHGDKALLVTEPSVFGLHDLRLAAKLLQTQGMPFGVVINKFQAGNTLIQDYCKESGIPLLGTLSYARKAAEAYSRGQMLIDLPEFRQEFAAIAKAVWEVL